MGTGTFERKMLDPKQIVVDVTRNRKIDPTSEEQTLLVQSMKKGGFIGHEDLVCTLAPDGKTYLDAGYRRHAAALAAGIKSVPCVIYSRRLDDKTRWIDKAVENATVPLQWAEQAELASHFDTIEEAAGHMAITTKWLASIVSAWKKLSGYRVGDLLPEAVFDIAARDALELSRFKKADVAEAYNHLIETGSLPSREPGSQGAGGGPKTERVKWLKKLGKDFPHVPWGQLERHLKLKEKSDVEWLEKFADFVDETTEKELGGRPAESDDE